MSMVLALGLATALEPVFPDIEHRTRIAHPSGAVEATYRARIAIAHRQVGMDAKPGMASSARCAWRVDIAVERAARHRDGARLDRQLTRQGVVKGARPGWCAAQRAGIARDVARRTDQIEAQVMALADADAPLLRAEIERLDGTQG